MAVTIGAQLDQLAVGKYHKRATIIIGVGLFFEFFEVFLASVLGSVLSEEFHVKSSMLSLLLGSSFLGMFIGAIFLGRLADKIGRKKAFLINLGIYSIFTFCIALSPNVGFIILFRFLAGLGLGAQPALCDAYLSEIIPTAKRGKYIAWAYTLSFLSIPAEGFLARMLVPLTPLGIEGWRWMFIIGSIGALIVFLTAHLLPESPRWLATAGKWDEAAEVFKKLGGSKTQAEEFRAKASLTQRDAAQQDRQSRPIFQKKWMKNTIMLYIFQIFQTIGYYGFGTLSPLVLAQKGYNISHSLEYIALSFIGYPLGALLSVPLIEKIDRKWLVSASAFGMGVFGILFVMGTIASMIIVFGFIYTLCSNIFSNAFHVLQAEIFPTEIRATATGAAYSVSRLMSGLMPFILLPVLEHQGATTMFAIVALAMIIVILDISLLAPRTTGRSLEHIENAYDDAPPIRADGVEATK